ncbi:hypothetical protein L210DRAFT_871355 [Boletus edulis BED1]|uniref:Uncharacterized protein n=1 Tax=Boletus edulis BED1 TaxID=1328754 RepID=A0AAD4BFB3_BOLED|nr:hypothetical protein L210DRAFT_3695145 [Boletus edulis BED1]KAF8425799.1 hypothetical protein L210DRAFT_871355 [Boletus edulis BED1]
MDLLVDCTNKSQELVEDAYKTRLFKQCLDKVLPLCNGTDKAPLVDASFRSSHSPIYLRPPRARLYLGIYFSVYAVGMVGTAYGIYLLAFVCLF